MAGEVKLKAAGSNLVGLCPFHDEKTGSFNINVSNNYYHCFGCGASGNVLSYVMETKGFSFLEAVEYLAQKFNITLKHEGGKKKAKSDISGKEIYQLNALAQEFFRSALKDNSKKLVSYLEDRGFDLPALKPFALGYAPAGWDNLYQFFQSRKIPEKLMLASGLIKKNSSGKIYDVFRDRVIFPIWIDGQRIAGFGGRIIEEDADKKQAKYLNSPETLVYHKSQILFGFPQAIKAVKSLGYVYLVEGYFDVIRLHQMGVCNVVATCGTAVTPQHLKKLNHVATVSYTHLTLPTKRIV